MQKLLWIGITICLWAIGLHAKGEVSKVYAHYEDAVPIQYTIYGKTHKWGQGKNLIIDGFDYQGKRYSYASLANRVVIRRSDNPYASGDTCGLFVQKYQNSYSQNYKYEPTYPAGCDMGPVMGGRIINVGALDLFKNRDNGSASEKNIERVDFITDSGIVAPSNSAYLAKVGHVVTEKSGNNYLQIAAILALDANGNPSQYGPLVYINKHYDSSSKQRYGLATIYLPDGSSLYKQQLAFVNKDKNGHDPYPHRTSQSHEPMGLSFVSLEDLGIAPGQRYYGFSYFGRDVTSNAQNKYLVDYTKFPKDTSGDTADPYGGVAAYFADEEILPQLTPQTCDQAPDDLVTFHSDFDFNKYSSVLGGTGSVGTLARYAHVVMRNGEDLDLLVMVESLKGIPTLYNSGSSTPRGFKFQKINGTDPSVGFFIGSKKEDPEGTEYEVTLRFTFVKSGTFIPVSLNFEAQVYDIDNFANRTEEIKIDNSAYRFFQTSDDTHIKGVKKGGLDVFFNREDEDSQGFAKNAMVKFVYQNRSSFTMHFAQIKNKSSGHGIGKAGFNLVFGATELGLPACEQEDIEIPDPVSEYRLDGCNWSGQEGEVKDQRGVNDAKTQNGLLSLKAGKIRRAAHFEGAEYIDAGDSFNEIFGPTNEKFTITAWIKPTQLTNAQTNHHTKNTFIAKASDDKNDNIEIGVNPNGSLHLYLDTKGKDKYADFGSGLTTDQWHFVAVSYDGNRVRVKIDDTLYTNTTTWSNGGKIDQAVGSPFTIGASLHVDNFFHGNIDELKIYDKVLSDEVVETIYQKEKNDDGSDRESQTCLAGEYRFDACEWFEPSAKVKDSAGLADATPGDAYPSTDAIIGRSARIKETLVEAEPDYQFRGHPFALSFWMKLEKLPATPFMAIMRKEFELYVKSDGQINLNPKNGENDIESVQKVAAGEWHYLTISSDGQTVTLYMDGTLQGSANAQDLGKYGTTVLELGATGWGDAEKFDGYIDELKIFDGALTAAEINALIDLDNAGKNYDGSDRAPLVCLDPIGCTDKAIVIDDTKYVHQIDLVTGDKNTTVMNKDQINGVSINGFGYNVKDGYLWGSYNPSKGGYLVKVGKDANGEFAQKKVGPIEGLPTDRGTYVGDIDYNGRLYLYYPATKMMYIINLNRNLPNYLKVIDSFQLSKKLAIADMAFNPKDKQLYAIENDNDLYRINVQNHGVTLVKKNAVNERTDTFGSSFFDAQGFFYAIKNSSRNVYRIDMSDPSNIRSLIFSTLVNEQVQHVNIDGGRCNLKPIYTDYGDAPDGSSYSTGDGTGRLNYRTLTSDNGARHRLPSSQNQTNVYLGSGVSAESDAKSSITEYNYDDDDGIVDTIPLLYTSMFHYSLKLKVTNDTNQTAHLSGWIDFNRNGRFETKEGVGANVAPLSQQIVTLHWPVPDDIVAGVTYARFRVTTDEMGISESDSYGPKGDGEVEDWEMEIKEGSLYDAWDTDSDPQHRVIKTKLVNRPFALSVASVGRDGQLKESMGSNIRARIVSKDDGSILTNYQDVNLSVANLTALSFPAIAKATREAVVELQYIDERNITREVNATDMFAIRPDHFALQFDSSPLIAAKDFNLTLQAKDANGKVVDTFTQDKESYLLDINETKTAAACGEPITPTKEEKHDFDAGTAYVSVNYPDIGNLKFWLREKPGREFAHVDAGDTPDSERFISDANTTHMVDPAKIRLEWSLQNGDTSNSATYFNSYNPLDAEAKEMKAQLDLKVSVKNDHDQNLKKFTRGCYARDIDLNMNMKIDSDDHENYQLLASYQDQNDTYLSTTSKLPANLVSGNNTIDDLKIESSLFEEGIGEKKIKLNFARSASKPLNPLYLRITDINASLDTLIDADTTEKSLRFLYVRAHIGDQHIVGNRGDAKVHYEVYCKGCSQSAFGLDGLAESEDSINWYILKNTLGNRFFDFEDPVGINQAGTSLDLSKPSGNSLIRMQVSKLPTTVRVKYKPRKYLLFNLVNPSVTTHSFMVDFVSEGKSWGGRGKVGYTVDTHIAPRNNMDIIDW